MLEELKKQVYEANMELPKRGLVTYYLGKCQPVLTGNPAASLSSPAAWIMTF